MTPVDVFNAVGVTVLIIGILTAFCVALFKHAYTSGYDCGQAEGKRQLQLDAIVKGHATLVMFGSKQIFRWLPLPKDSEGEE